jgi:hypothetical protein
VLVLTFPQELSVIWPDFFSSNHLLSSVTDAVISSFVLFELVAAPTLEGHSGDDEC